MPRRKSGRIVNGWLNFDKPLGMSSAQAVAKIRHLFKARKVGHAGTLDPLASGVLPLAFGQATKTIGFMQDAVKTYEIDIIWGQATSTDDKEGEVIATSSHRPTQADIEAEIKNFIGTIEQVPPDYSAIKQDGQRAYRLARAGEAVALAPRFVRIDDIEVLGVAENGLTLRVVCGKGVYMRALARDLAIKLGTKGHIGSLRRTKVGIFDENSIITLEKLNDLSHSAPDLTASILNYEALDANLAPLHTVLADIPALVVDADFALRLRYGQLIPQSALLDFAQEYSAHIESGERFCVYENTGDTAGLVAICYLAGGVLKPLRVFTHNNEGEHEA